MAPKASIHPEQLKLGSEQITSVYEPKEHPELTPEQDKKIEREVQQGVGNYGEAILHATGVNVLEEPEAAPSHLRKRFRGAKQPTTPKEKAWADARPDLSPFLTEQWEPSTIKIN